MSEIVNERRVFSLYDVSTSIKRTIEDRYTSPFWVKAEMSKLNFYRQSGHCYPDLVEKQNGKVVAQVRSNLWKDDYTRVNNTFLRTIKEPLKDGIKILFLAKVNFDPVFGLSLRIIDIDPSFTLGDIERERQETVDKLKLEAIFDKNKSLKFPLLPQRIAIISDETSKGYADFKEVIDKNPWKYKIFYLLFPSLLQGEKSVVGIMKQLAIIKRIKHHFDAVAIIRGGGGDIGLSAFNNYQLCREIALFPIPVITGIGHSTNETVSELVSYSNQITPTKLAEYILQRFHNYSVPVQKAQEKIVEQSKRIIREANSKFQSDVKLFRSLVENMVTSGNKDLNTKSRTLTQQVNFILKTAKGNLLTNSQKLKSEAERTVLSSKQLVKLSVQLMKKDVSSQLRTFTYLLIQRTSRLMSGVEGVIRSNKNSQELYYTAIEDGTRDFFSSQLNILGNLERNIANMSPEKVLKRGYSITLLNGKAVRSVDELQIDDTLETVLLKGSLKSIIKTINKHKDE